jgi:exopolysaccharide biosynthesis predicted pyruvyltransferase EpsI
MGEIDILEFLSEYKNSTKEIIYIPNPGNAGDALIAHGTLKVFDKIGLSYTFGTGKYPNRKRYNQKILIYAGGGSLNDLYPGVRSKEFILNNCNRRGNEIVVLPHTIKEVDSLLSQLGNNVKIICRERISYDYVRGTIKNVDNVFLSDDMAMHIDGLGEYTKRTGVGVCNCFRTDVTERTDIDIPMDNVDLSFELEDEKNTGNPEVIKRVSLSVFDYLSKYETINTNRLHMGIAGSLLGRQVNMHPNSYYKNFAIYEYSLKGRYPNTMWMGV